MTPEVRLLSFALAVASICFFFVGFIVGYIVRDDEEDN
jgi:hypothetical protein